MMRPLSLERHGWVVALLAALGLWSAVVALAAPSYLPSPAEVAAALVAGVGDGGLATAWSGTVLHWLRGFAVAAVVGSTVGVALGLLPVLSAASSPLISFLRCLPGIAVLPLIVLLVGLNGTAISAVVAFSAVWFVLLNAVEGVRRVEAVTLETAATYHVTGLRRTMRVILPAAAPSIVTGWKMALGLGLVVCVSAELVVGTPGLGSYVARAQAALQPARAFAGVVLAAVTGLASLHLAGMAERRLVHWVEDVR